MIIVISIFFSNNGILFAQPTLFDWAKQIGNGFACQVNYSKVSDVDSLGNIYCTGSYIYTTDFDPGSGVFNLTSTGFCDAFILKLDNIGNFIWAKKIGGTGTAGASSSAIKLDSDGNIYSIGSFSETVDFDSGSGTYNLTSLGEDLYICKHDSMGNLIWAKGIGGLASSTVSGSSINVDKIGNLYITGKYNGTIDCDPNSGVYNLTPIISGSDNIFILKLNSSGNFVWAKSIEGTGSKEGKSIANDSAGNVYTTGFFEGNVDFDPNPGVYNLSSSVGSLDAFICKLDSSGNFVWAKNVGGSSSITTSNSLELDMNSNVFISGNFTGTSDFNPNSGVFNLTPLGYSDIYILKLDLNGNFIWVKSIQGAGLVSINDKGMSIAIDKMGNIYSTGYFQGSLDFDPGVGVYNLSTILNSDNTFISKHDNSGNLIWAKKIDGSIGVRGLSISLDKTNNLYTIGMHRGTVDFNPDAANFILTGMFDSVCGSYGDIFIHKMSQVEITTNFPTSITKNNFEFYPNPNTGIINVLMDESIHNTVIEIYNSIGIIVKKTEIKGKSLVINIEQEPNGFYIIKAIRDKKVIAIEKIVKQ